MRIGLISYEYPPDTAFGGIATYVKQVAHLLFNDGYDVEVFSASETKEGKHQVEGVSVNYIKSLDRKAFKDLVLPVFSKQHQLKPFDIIESPEYNADGLRIKEKYPHLPLTVKLHTPGFLIDELSGNIPKLSKLLKLRILIAAYRRFKKPDIFWKYFKKNDPEFLLTTKAQLITSPSISLGDIVAAKWNIRRDKITTLPYPFIPSQKLLDIPVENDSKIITYFGRLEVRKGVQILSKVIPAIVQKYPDYIFRFVGKDQPYPGIAHSMKNYLSDQLAAYKNNIEFIEQVSQDKIPDILKEASVCIFPSIWENFPNVCLESMSAGKAIIGSKNGGMKDMLEFPEAGLLVDPLSADEIIAALEKMINSNTLRFKLGRQARKSVLEKYNTERISELIKTQYNKIIIKK